MTRLETLSVIASTAVLSAFCGLLLLYALSNGRPQDLAAFYHRAPAPIAIPTP